MDTTELEKVMERIDAKPNDAYTLGEHISILNDARKAMAKAAGRIENLAARQVGLEGTIKTLNEELASTKTDAGLAKNRADELETANSVVRQDLSVAGGEIAALKSERDEMKESLSTEAKNHEKAAKENEKAMANLVGDMKIASDDNARVIEGLRAEIADQNSRGNVAVDGASDVTVNDASDDEYPADEENKSDDEYPADEENKSGDH